MGMDVAEPSGEASVGVGQGGGLGGSVGLDYALAIDPVPEHFHVEVDLRGAPCVPGFGSKN